MPLHTKETVKASLVWYMEDGNVGGGLDLLWTRGAHVVICQPWEYRCAGNDYGQVYPDPMSGDDLIDYFNDAIKGRQKDGRDLVWTDVRVFN